MLIVTINIILSARKFNRIFIVFNKLFFIYTIMCVKNIHTGINIILLY